jgi:hypothetical protein
MLRLFCAQLERQGRKMRRLPHEAGWATDSQAEDRAASRNEDTAYELELKVAEGYRDGLIYRLKDAARGKA